MEKSEIYINALIQNDESVIKEIYDELFPKVKNFIVRNGGNTDEAQDIFHDALLYIIVTQKDKAMNIQSFEAYLFTICKNMWKRISTKRVMKAEVPTLVDDSQELGRFMLEQECFDFYIDKFQMLSKNCQEILSEYFNNQSYEDLMKEFSYGSVNTIRQRVYKCRIKLIKLIKEDIRYKKIIAWGSI
ncbi:MAG: sigma-70 family RNA polymerase sigma factor [Cyclobacteriaceae bacterium]